MRRCSLVTASKPTVERTAALPLVSVVMPVYNGAPVVAEAIDSVLAQTYPSVEVVIVDDGSTDGTPEVLARYADRAVVVRQHNQGLAAARNAGFRRSTGTYVAWIDHDDVWLPEKLGLQVAFMRRYPECVLVATDFSAFDAAGDIARSYAARYYAAIAQRGLSGIFSERLTLSTVDVPGAPGLPEAIPVYMGRIDEQLIWGNCLHPPTVLMTREATLEAGLADPRYGSHGVDYEFFLRLARTGPVAFIDHPLIRYRHSEGQLSSDRNLAQIALSSVAILEELERRDPHLRDNPAFRRRVATSHLEAAHALAESDGVAALRHLAKSGAVDVGLSARTVAKVLAPRALLQLYRVRRSSSA